MDPNNLKTYTISALKGYQQQPQMRERYFQARYEALAPYKSSFQAMMDEQYLIDDMYRTDIDDYLKRLVTGCETLIFLDVKAVVGIAIFNNIVVGRSAEFAGWVAPEYRSPNYQGQKAVKLFADEDVLDYAWNELKLVKMEARVATSNLPGQSFMKNVGFARIGEIAVDLQFYDQLFDSVLFELVNPAFRLPPVEERIHGIRRQEKQQFQLTDVPAADDGEAPANDEPSSWDDSDDDSSE